MSIVVIEEMSSTIDASVDALLSRLGGAARFLKSSREVYVKVNGVDSQPHSYTTPDFTAAVVRAFRNAGARRVVVIENATQGNLTRVVFDATGMTRAVRCAGGETRCLDEERAAPVTLPGGPFSRGTVRFPATVRDILRRRDEVTYVNLPKLKTHSMTDVTLGVKNQWGFPAHADRIDDHNFRLSAKIAAISELIAPDLTIIEGATAVIHGHYPARQLAHRSIVPVGVLVGGEEVVAVDMVGATILGFAPEAVEHLRLAADGAVRSGRTAARLRFEDVRIVGKMPAPLAGEATILDVYPKGVRFVGGAERVCREGCVGNPRAVLQVLGLDHQGAGEFLLVFGRGHDIAALGRAREPIFLAGDCAIAELGTALLGANRRVYVSLGCNNLPDTVAGLCALIDVPFQRLLPMSALRTLLSVARSAAHRTTSRLVPLRPVRLDDAVVRAAKESVARIDAVERAARPIGSSDKRA